MQVPPPPTARGADGFRPGSAMLNARLKDFVVGRILPGVSTPAQYIGGELNSVRKDHRECAGTLCLAFPDTYALGMSHHGLQVLYSLMNARGWSCERSFTPLPDFEAELREHGLPLYSLETFTPLRRVRRARLLAPVRDLLHERPDDARPRRHPAARRGPRAGRHAGDRGRAGGPESRADRALHRPVRHRRRRAEPAGRLRPLEVDAGRPVAVSRGQAREDRRVGRLGLRAAVLRVRVQRRRHDRRHRADPRRRAGGDQAVHDHVARRDPAAAGADRPVRRDDARPDRHRDHARLPLAVPVLPEHRHQAAAAVSHGRDDRQRRARELPEHRPRRDQPALALDERLSRTSRSSSRG